MALGKRKNGITVFSAVVLLIFFAVFFRILSRYAQNDFLNAFYDFLSALIHIGLFSAWGFSLVRRIIHSQLRRLLITVDLLEIFWLTVREFKFRFVVDPDAIRMLWYLYYVPVLLIPLIAVFVSMSLNADERYRLPKWTSMLFIPTVVLMFLVLTNDWHQLAFSFPENAEVRSEFNCKYGIVFYLCLAWIAVCSLASLVLMLVRSRLPQSKKYIWAQLLPFAASAVYLIMFAMNVPFIKMINDMAVFCSLAFSAYFEICIQCGLIPSNTDYYTLFRASVGVPIYITDKDYNVKYSARNAEYAQPQDVERAAEGSVITESGKRLHSMSVNGGYAVWTEDISELVSAKESLEDIREQLRERNALLEYEYQKEKDHKTVEEQNRLYDLLQSKTQQQIDSINSLVRQYKKSDNESEKQRILSRIVVLGSFVKRRKDFVLSLDSQSQMPVSKLSSAFAESCHSMKLLGITGSCYTEMSDERADGRVLTLAYEFFEDVLEAVLDKIKFFSVSVSEINSSARIRIITDCIYENGDLNLKYADVRIFNDEDSTVFLLPLEGGETP